MSVRRQSRTLPTLVYILQFSYQPAPVKAVARNFSKEGEDQSFEGVQIFSTQILIFNGVQTLLDPLAKALDLYY